MDRQDKEGRLRSGIAQLLPQLRAAARLLTSSRAEADDLVQESLLRMLHGLGSFELAPEYGGDLARALRPWGMAILRNTFREAWRRKRREDAHLAAQRLEDVGQEGGQETVSMMRDLALALATLPPALREALVLVGAQGLSHEEAASICAVPVGTMKARVSRARRQLARTLGPVMP